MLRFYGNLKVNTACAILEKDKIIEGRNGLDLQLYHTSDSMKNGIDLTDEWNIKTGVGPISFNIYVNYAFFICDEGNSIRHKHAACEFHFIASGNGFVCTDDATYDIMPDSYFIIQNRDLSQAKSPVFRADHPVQFQI